MSKTHKIKYKQWTLIDWDGNPALKLKCWRKSFGRGQVSVGAGGFDLICYDYGANGERSLSGTRWNYDCVLTEEEAMAEVDACGGYYDRTYRKHTPAQEAIRDEIEAIAVQYRSSKPLPPNQALPDGAA